ncbi:hypothetical protein D1632_17755 [Chryseobacterium nematophagum]|uniref:Uncharacterized protein n=1 Tax=Chryseobacterium nematophagum TaxID=2305228 RepID=A0A3M7L9B2_9FLAO|nr:hypothetical protein [Chryseobacterium nematophagum]RMZ58132.1 hypothetical protein D1632_17755 [Chryseobacterium nematophagum]
MKHVIIIITVAASLLSCSKKEADSISGQKDSIKTIDSINTIRTKINDSIKVKNNKNRFQDLSGDHKFTHNLIKAPGSVNFKKMGRDDYDVSGSIKAGKNYVTINGTAIAVSSKHINFTGEIKQSIGENDNGKPYIRKGTKTFMSKDGGKTYRLQDMVNSSGFVDYIDIYF